MENCDEDGAPLPDGMEAEELREGIEELLRKSAGGVVMVSDLQKLLYRVDARDCSGVVVLIAELRVRIAQLESAPLAGKETPG